MNAIVVINGVSCQDGLANLSARYEFLSLMSRADIMGRVESDPIRSDWWVGYRRGLRRAHYGEQFGSQDEHEIWFAAIESSDPQRNALGRGYHAGLTLTSREPE